MPRDYDFGRLIAAYGSDRLAETLQKSPLPRAALLAAAPKPHPNEPYGRRALFQDATGEVLLIGWREGAFCLPHDHGAAEGMVYALRGAFVERRWTFAGGRLRADGEHRFEAPDSFRVTAGDVHDMAASGGGVSLHVYVPRIASMTVFDRTRRESLILDDACGAWIPEDPRLVRARAPWPGAPSR